MTHEDAVRSTLYSRKVGGNVCSFCYRSTGVEAFRAKNADAGWKRAFKEVVPDADKDASGFYLATVIRPNSFTGGKDTYFYKIKAKSILAADKLAKALYGGNGRVTFCKRWSDATDQEKEAIINENRHVMTRNRKPRAVNEREFNHDAR